MRKAIATFPAENATRVEREVHVLTNMKQFPEYKKQHPFYALMLKDTFKKVLSEGDTIIVNDRGGWCTNGETVKIVKYLD